LLSGALKSIPLEWLPIFLNTTSTIRRRLWLKSSIKKRLKKSMLFQMLSSASPIHLKLRKPF